MKAKKLTQLTVEKLSPPAAGRVEHFDSLVRGFGLRITTKGHKSWIVLARLKNRKQIRVTIGSFDTYPKVDVARERARAILQDVAEGKDPTAKIPQAAIATTLCMAAADYIERHARPKNRSWKNTEALIANHVLPSLGDKEMRVISRADVSKLLRALSDAGMSAGASNVFRTSKHFFRWAVEEQFLDRSPMEGMKPPSKATERDRVLEDDDLKRVLKASEVIEGYGGGLVRFLIVTGQRRSEVATMKWDDIDLEKRIWRIARERAKNDIAHEVPLSPLALMILDNLPPRSGPFVFAGRRAFDKGEARPTAISGFSKLKIKLDAKVTSDGGRPMAAWTLHDLRRTCGTGMARLGVPVSTISKVLNHAEGGVTRIYVRHGFIDEKRQALDEWARKVESLINSSSDASAMTAA